MHDSSTHARSSINTAVLAADEYMRYDRSMNAHSTMHRMLSRTTMPPGQLSRVIRMAGRLQHADGRYDVEIGGQSAPAAAAAPAVNAIPSPSLSLTGSGRVAITTPSRTRCASGWFTRVDEAI